MVFPCDREALFTWFVDFERFQQWNDRVLAEEAETDTGVSSESPGFRSRVLVQEPGDKVWYQKEILEFQRPGLLRITLRGGRLGDTPMETTYEFLAHGDGSELKYRSVWEPKDFFLTLLTPVIKIGAYGNIDRSLQKLKTIIEDRG